MRRPPAAPPNTPTGRVPRPGQPQFPPGGFPPGQIPPGGMPPAPAPQQTPATPAVKPAPVFAGTVRVRVYTNVIATGENGTIAAPKDLEKMKERVAKVDGVKDSQWDATSGELRVTYTGSYDNVDEIERAAAGFGAQSALISPAVLTFKAYDARNEDSLIAALKGVPGVIEAVRDPKKGYFYVYGDVTTVSLTALTEAAEKSGNPGQITSHEEISMRLVETPGCDRAKLERALSDTKHVLKIELSADKIKVVATRGQVSKTTVKKLAATHGFKT